MTGIISAGMMVYVLFKIGAPVWAIGIMIGSIFGDLVIAAYKVGKGGEK